MDDNPSNRPGWIAYTLALAIVMGVGMVAMAEFGVPGGSDGGSSPNQQEASGAPAPGPATTGSR